MAKKIEKKKKEEQLNLDLDKFSSKGTAVATKSKMIMNKSKGSYQSRQRKRQLEQELGTQTISDTTSIRDSDCNKTDTSTVRDDMTDNNRLALSSPQVEAVGDPAGGILVCNGSRCETQDGDDDVDNTCTTIPLKDNSMINVRSSVAFTKNSNGGRKRKEEDGGGASKTQHDPDGTYVKLTGARHGEIIAPTPDDEYTLDTSFNGNDGSDNNINSSYSNDSYHGEIFTPTPDDDYTHDTSCYENQYYVNASTKSSTLTPTNKGDHDNDYDIDADDIEEDIIDYIIDYVTVTDDDDDENNDNDIEDQSSSKQVQGAMLVAQGQTRALPLPLPPPASPQSKASLLSATMTMTNGDSIASSLSSLTKDQHHQKPTIDNTSKFSLSMRIVIVIVVVLVSSGLVGGGLLTWYFLDNTQIESPSTTTTTTINIIPQTTTVAPIVENNDKPPIALSTSYDNRKGQPEEDEEFYNDEYDDDETLLRLFASVVGDSVYSDTIAGAAAIWMLYEDPSRKIIPSRSTEGWIQRYLLVYLYYSSTNNRSTTWLSCNPSLMDDTEEPLRKGEDELDTPTITITTPTDDDACRFTYPTELSDSGRIIYELVPSYRWLSGMDECRWGGITCDDNTTVGTTTIHKTQSAVTSIILADQYLTGSIVTEVTQLPYLQVLDLSHNGLTGTLPDGFHSSLQIVRLQYNALSGSIPSTFFDFNNNRMTELNLGSNQITGTIPSQIAVASQLEELFLFNNQLTGTIPIELGNMPLRIFHGYTNQLTGSVFPAFDTGNVEYSGGIVVKTIRVWWMYQNQMTGSIPTTIGSVFTNLEDLRIQNNKITGTLPDSISKLSNLFRLEVQSNFLSGTIPEDMGTATQTAATAAIPTLRDVKLQFNSFTGGIPSALCFLESMEVLEADCLLPPTTLYSSVVPTATNTATTTNECYCCTTCCNAGTEKCVMY